MSGGVWKDAAMRLYDTATNFECAVAAYLRVQDKPHENHVNATWRKFSAAKQHVYAMAQADRRQAEAAQAGITPPDMEPATVRSPLECPRCGGRTMHAWVGDEAGTRYYVACQTCGLSSSQCRTEKLANESWKDVIAQMEAAKKAGKAKGEKPQ